MTEIKITKTDIEKGMRNEERNEAMNMMNSAQKTNSREFDKGYDQIKWGIPEVKEWWGYVGKTRLLVSTYNPADSIMDERIEAGFLVVGPVDATTREDARVLLNKELRKCQ
jgi:hypothetical protein